MNNYCNVLYVTLPKASAGPRVFFFTIRQSLLVCITMYKYASSIHTFLLWHSQFISSSVTLEILNLNQRLLSPIPTLTTEYRLKFKWCWPTLFPFLLHFSYSNLSKFTIIIIYLTPNYIIARYMYVYQFSREIEMGACRLPMQQFDGCKQHIINSQYFDAYRIFVHKGDLAPRSQRGAR